jgi:hypothetical protein
MGFGGSATRARDEARAWAERDVACLLESREVVAAELIELEQAGDLHPLWYDWLLIAHVADQPEALRRLDELFEELRSVNARPILLRDVERRPL